jgi:hypothetical protein
MVAAMCAETLNSFNTTRLTPKVEIMHQTNDGDQLLCLSYEEGPFTSSYLLL